MLQNQNTSLILGLNGEIHQINTIEEILITLFGEKYLSLSPKEKLLYRYNVAYPISILNNLDIAISTKGIVLENFNISPQNVDNSHTVLIDDDITLLLSLARINEIQIYEKSNENIFSKYLDKSKFTSDYINIRKLF